jgi:hypothetical protein
MGDYNQIEKVKPKWRERWRRPLIKLGKSRGIIIPKPILSCLGARLGRCVYIGWIIDENSNRDMLVLDFE